MGISLTLKSLLITAFLFYLVSQLALFIIAYANAYFLGLMGKNNRNKFFKFYLDADSEYYDQVKILLPHSDNQAKDKTIYMNTGRLWLTIATSEAIYYGRYVTEMNDSFIDRAFKEKKT